MEIIIKVVTDEIKNLVNNISLEDLRNKDVYKQFMVMVKIKPNNDFLPIRTYYKGNNETNNLGINYLTSNKEIWYALPDVIASKIYTGKSPEILEAIRFIPNGVQENLNQSKIVEVDINPKKDNLIKILVEERQKIKNKLNILNKEDKKLDGTQKALKILVNAFSYGIFLELNPKDTKKKIKVYGLNDFSSDIKSIEEVGKYYNPILASIITSGARLFLMIAQKLAEDLGHKHYYMDTDSVFISPSISNKLIDYFKPLSPYSVNVPLLKKDKENVYFYGICSKRYCLYSLLDNQIVLKDHKLHGLGHLMNPYNTKKRENWHEDI